MARRKVSLEMESEMQRDYGHGQGLSISEISRKYGVALSTAWGHTALLETINPETGELFTSLGEYEGFWVGQIKSKRGEQKYSSPSDYKKKLRQRALNTKKCRDLRNLIDDVLMAWGMEQRELAEILRISRQMISYYRQGSFPRDDGIICNLKALLPKD